MSQIAMIGGIFLKAEDPHALAAWYSKHFELEFQDWGSCQGLAFSYLEKEGATQPSSLIFSIHKAKSPLPPDRGQCVINYRVFDLAKTLKHLRQQGLEITEKEESDYGKFAWVNDPEGNRIELWEAPENMPET